MKTILVLGVIVHIAIVSAAFASFEDLVVYVNSNQTLWEARGKNTDAKAPVVTVTNVSSNTPGNPYKKTCKCELPHNFDARLRWKRCPSINEIRDQGSCWSSWAVAAVSAMTDRYCIQTKGRDNFHFSELDLMTCCMNCGSICGGGILREAWSYAAKKGIVSGGNEGCRPYQIPKCKYDSYHSGFEPQCAHNVPRVTVCQHKCQANYTKPYIQDRKKLQVVYKLKDVKAIMMDIYKKGPVTTTFEVHEDFLKYHKGIYRHVAGQKIGLQAVKLIGWGQENGVKYWLAANSWGQSWGDNGFFKIIRGQNHLGIELIAYAGSFYKK